MPNRPRTIALACVIVALLTGCPVEEEAVEDPCAGACLDIDPRHFDFGEVPVGGEGIRGFTLSSVGGEPATIEYVWLDGPETLTLDDSLLASPLAPGEDAWFRVAYAPQGEESLEAHVHVHSDDAVEPMVSILLKGLGTAPVIELTPTAWDAGSPDVGCDQAMAIQLRNAGSAPLTLHSVTLETESDEFVEEHSFGDGTVLQPLGLQVISVFYRPLDEQPDEAAIIVVSDDPQQPEVMVPLTGVAQVAGLGEDTFQVQGEAAADLLFVIDNTETMAWYQASAGVYGDVIRGALTAAPVDLRVGVITTDDAALVGPLLEPSDAGFADAFAAQVGVGLLGDPWEQGLAYARDAVTPPLTDPGGANEGLLRETAALHVLVVSDTDDHSGGDVADYLDALAAVQPGAGFVTVHAMTGQVAGCSGPAGVAGPAPRYEQAVALTGGRSTSICDMEWEDWLAGVAWQPPHVDGRFGLSAEPVPETLEVEVDGAPVTAGWSLDPYDPVIVFEAGAIPALGSEVTVRYARAGDC